MATNFRRINWRLLALHLTGVPFLVLGLRQLFVIRHVQLIRLRLQYGDEFWRHIDAKTTIGSLILELQLLETFAFLLAILAACSFLGLVIWRRRESLLLPLLLFVGGVLLNWTGLYSLPVILSFRKLLSGDVMVPSIYYRLAISGSFLLLIGLLPFLLTWRRTYDSLPVEKH